MSGTQKYSHHRSRFTTTWASRVRTRSTEVEPISEVSTYLYPLALTSTKRVQVRTYLTCGLNLRTGAFVHASSSSFVMWLPPWPGRKPPILLHSSACAAFLLFFSAPSLEPALASLPPPSRPIPSPLHSHFSSSLNSHTRSSFLSPKASNLPQTTSNREEKKQKKKQRR